MSLLALALASCGVENIVHGVDEKEANSIVVLLSDNGISANKVRIEAGRIINYNIGVPSKDKMDALRVLDTYDFPKRAVSDYAKVFGEGGLIPTAAEERAKQISAIEGEIEKQLRLISGVLDVEVNIVQPEESALRTTQEVGAPTTASVAIKYLPGKGGAKPISEPQVQEIVAAAVERLTRDRVVVVMTPAARAAAAIEAACPEGGARGPLARLPPKTQNIVIAGVVALVLLLSLAVVFVQIRLRTVRGRLIRLQNEIARARRKPEVPAPAMP